MGAFFHYPAIFKYDDLIKMEKRKNTMRDDDGRPALQVGIQLADYLFFRFGVYCTPSIKHVQAFSLIYFRGIKLLGS